MNINYKNLFYIFHPDGKFTEDQLKKILDAAYNEGYRKGYNEGKNSFSITYPYTKWWEYPYYSITCNGTGTGNTTTTTTVGDTTNITPMSITTASNPPYTLTTTCTCENSSNCNCTKSQSPYGMEFKYNGTEK